MVPLAMMTILGLIRNAVPAKILMQMSVTAAQSLDVSSSVAVASVINVMFGATASLALAAARKVRLGPKWKMRVSIPVFSNGYDSQLGVDQLSGA
jgi:hypothetical protein